MAKAVPGRFSETLYPSYRQEFDFSGDAIIDEKSEYQSILLFDNEALGRVLVLDGNVQITDRDEAAYSEMLVHPAVYEHGDVKSVLIIGGGDGAVAEEVLKHETIETCDLCEIDPRVIGLAREHLGSVNKGVFDHPKFTLHLKDASDLIADPQRQSAYDLVISDRPDPVGPGQALFTEQFYQNCKNVLAPGGLAIFQTGVPFFQAEELVEALTHLQKVFPQSGVLLTVVPTYVGGFMALTWGGNGLALGTPDGIAGADRNFSARPVDTDYYTPALHGAAFALPRWIERLVEAAAPPPTTAP
ncbi:MAG: polyamine aminopropyltransferase [Pseudomonadota bacterium]